MGDRTLSEIVRSSFGHYRSSGAFFYRRGDGFEPISSEYFLETIRRLSLGFISLGLKKGDVVAIIAPSSPWWMMVDLAIMLAGGRSMALFPKISTGNLEFEMRDSAARFAYVDDSALLAQSASACKRVKSIIYRNVDCEVGNAISFEALLKMGDQLSIENPALYPSLGDQIDPGDVATIVYTSGSTGEPKGVMLTHANICSQIAGACQRFPLDPLTDRALSALPLAHCFERLVAYTYFAQGVPIYFADDVQRLKEYLPEVRPTVMTMVPRILEKLFTALQAKIGSAAAVTKMIGKWGSDIALEENPHGIGNMVADALFFKKIRQGLGGELQQVIVGGAALDEGLCRFFNHVGIPIYQGYGLSEAAPVLATNYPGRNSFGTVGPAFPGVQLRICGPESELRCKGPNIMLGYLNKPEATTARFDDEGWLCTGDRAHIDEEGNVTITGRLGEIFKSSTGEFVSPVPIEQALVKHPLVDSALVVANGRSTVGVLVFTEEKESFSLRKYIEEINQQFNAWERIRHYRLIHAVPSVETGQMTPTMKLCRTVVERDYGEVIESMFAEELP